jgi:hypothetical protein
MPPFLFWFVQARRACGGSQGRLRAARAAAGPALRATLLNPCRGRRGGLGGGGIFWGGGFGRFETPFVAVKKRDNLRPNDQRLRY